MGRREPTEEQRQAARDRRERFRGIVKDIAKMNDGERADLAGRLSGIATCEGHGLSLHNTLLLASQCPTATVVGGFQQWRRQGRQVRKGEHGHMIWCPVEPGKAGGGADVPQPSELANAESGHGSNDRARVRFMIGTVFDISQTDESGCSDA